MRALWFAVSILVFTGCGGNGALGTGTGADAGPADAGAAEGPPPKGIAPVAACGPAGACGGDVTGSWKVFQTCADLATGGGFPNCPQSSFDVTKLEIEGSFEFRADATYSSTTTTGGSLGLKLPKTCIPMVGQMQVGCVGFGALLTLAVSQSSMGQMMNPITRVDCTESGEICSCAFQLRPMPTVASGTWRTEGTTLYTKPTNGMESGADYCVQGNQLRLKNAVMTGMPGMMGGTAPQAVLVLQK